MPLLSFCMTNWRKIADLGLWQLYEEDLEFSIKLCQRTALALVSVDQIWETFKELKGTLPPESDCLVQCCDQANVGHYAQADAVNAAFRMRLIWDKWCNFESTLADEPRTTNALEGWYLLLKSVASEPLHFIFHL